MWDEIYIQNLVLIEECQYCNSRRIFSILNTPIWDRRVLISFSFTFPIAQYSRRRRRKTDEGKMSFILMGVALISLWFHPQSLRPSILNRKWMFSIWQLLGLQRTKQEKKYTQWKERVYFREITKRKQNRTVFFFRHERGYCHQNIKHVVWNNIKKWNEREDKKNKCSRGVICHSSSLLLLFFLHLHWKLELVGLCYEWFFGWLPLYIIKYGTA